MKITSKLLVITLIFLNLFCDDSDSKIISEVEEAETENLSGLYFICSMTSGSKVYAGWYHNGEYTLAEGSGGEIHPMPRCAAIDGPYLYIGGEIHPDYTPGYWENGEWFLIKEHGGMVVDIFADNNNVYGIFDGGNGAYSWINRDVTALSPYTFSPTAIALYNDQLIIYGNNLANKVQSPAYYSNGVLHKLPLPEDGPSYYDFAIVSSACVYNGDIYACGYLYNSETGYSLGYWKNNEWVSVNIGFGIIGRKIAVNENGVYIAGELEDRTPGFLHNSVWTSYENKLPNKDYTAIISSLLVIDSDIYISVNFLSSVYSEYYGGYYLNGSWNELEGDCDGEVCDTVAIEDIVYQ